MTAGLIGGYFGRVTQATTEWVFSLIMTFPGLLLLIILMPVTEGDYRVTMLIFGVLLSPGIYRIVRNLVLGVKNELYVDAARVSGLGNLRILGRHVLFVGPRPDHHRRRLHGGIGHRRAVRTGLPRSRLDSRSRASAR